FPDSCRIVLISGSRDNLMPLMKHFLAGVGLIAFTLLCEADDWPQWRGPHRNGISNEKGLLKEWPKDGPKLLWKVTNAGSGYSTPAVVGERLYLLGNEGLDNEFV